MTIRELINRLLELEREAGDSTTPVRYGDEGTDIENVSLDRYKDGTIVEPLEVNIV